MGLSQNPNINDSDIWSEPGIKQVMATGYEIWPEVYLTSCNTKCKR